MTQGNARKQLGIRGERLAADFFLAKGFSVIARNWTCKYGELDLVIRRGDEIRIVEVKTRRTSPGPWVTHETVSAAKMARVAEAAARFFAAHPELPQAAHFDVFTVTFIGNAPPDLQWLPDFE
jgi:putative endonuclease